MTDQDFNQPESSGAPIEAMPVEAPRRAASVTLRSDDARQSRAASLDAANKSLGDALRITYRLIQLVMIVLIALFAVSGFQKVEQAERGVKITLGELSSADLQPGFQFSLPYPLGQIIKVSTAQVKQDLDESFFPFLDKNQKGQSIEQLGFGDVLRPGRDNSLITGDGNLAHARFGVDYHRESPADLIQNIADDQEAKLVRAVVERAAVQVIAQVPLDQLLKRASARAQAAANSADAASKTKPPEGDKGVKEAVKGEAPKGEAPKSGETPPAAPSPAGASSGVPARSSVGSEIEDRIRRVAQKSLDEMKSGLRIDTVSMRDETPPLRTRQSYQDVQTAESKAAQAREEAQKARDTILNTAAGAAYPVLLALIDEYGARIDAKDSAGAEQTLDTLFNVLEGKLEAKPLKVAGVDFTVPRMAGDAATRVQEALRYRSGVVQEAKGQEATFRAKLSQYRANPRVFITREWVDGLTDFLKQDQVEALVLPDKTSPLVLRISSDPDIVKEIRARLQKKAVESNWELKRAYDAGQLPGDSK